MKRETTRRWAAAGRAKNEQTAGQKTERSANRRHSTWPYQLVVFLGGVGVLLHGLGVAQSEELMAQELPAGGGVHQTVDTIKADIFTQEDRCDALHDGVNRLAVLALQNQGVIHISDAYRRGDHENEMTSMHMYISKRGDFGVTNITKVPLWPAEGHISHTYYVTVDGVSTEVAC